MTSWLPDIEDRAGPKYLRIADAMGDAIRTGALEAGSKLPPMRNLAYDLGITLGTVSRAYQEAERRGYVGGEVGRGTYVKGDGRYPQPRGPRAFALGGVRDNGINMSMAVPPLGYGGDYLAQTMQEISQDPDLCCELADYQGHSGMRRHREAGVDWVARRGVHTNTDHITLTNGTQHAILISLMALTRPGDTILAEWITYPGLIHAAGQLGVKLAPVDMDEDGMIPAALQAAIAEHRPSAVYIVPTVQNPTTTTMSAERRQAIADILIENRLLAIEDDIWGFLTPEGVPSIAELAPAQVVYITGLSKAMAPGLRVGYIASPPGATPAVRAVARMSSWMVPPLMAEIAKRWLDDGSGDRLIEWQRSEAAERMKVASEVLGEFDIRGEKHSYQIWLHLPEPWRAETFRRQAEARGVYVLSGGDFVIGRNPAPHAIRICVGSCRTKDEVRQGCEAIRDILKGPVGAPVAA